VKRVLVVFLCGLFAAGCKGPNSVTTSAPRPWYASYFESSLSVGETFHSELHLTAGQKAELKIAAKEPIIVGFTLEKGYDVHQSKGSFWIGTPDTPHKAGGAPGVSDKFVPTEGTITLIVENDSPVDTRVAIYTQPVKKD
jgi:hypothetical protein